MMHGQKNIKTKVSKYTFKTIINLITHTHTHTHTHTR